jgi:hypothetical protein
MAHTADMSFGSGPLTGWAFIRALFRRSDAAARTAEAGTRRAVLDEAELHDLEDAEYAGVKPAAPHPSAPVRRRSFLSRLLGR